MNPAHHAAFVNLYPDVDPAHGIPLTVPERLALTVAAAVMAYGAVLADPIIAGVGLVLTVFASIAQQQKTARRIRLEARQRFPNEDWAEARSQRRLKLLVPLFFAAILAVVAAAFWFLPAEHAALGAAIAAVVVGALVWFMPGLNPVWSR